MRAPSCLTGNRDSIKQSRFTRTLFPKLFGLMMLAWAAMFPLLTSAQVTIGVVEEPATAVNEILKGKGVKIRNVMFRGHPEAFGAWFMPESMEPGGLLLSTGKAEDAAGPNDHPKKSTVLGIPGDRTLQKFVDTRSFDACALEFDFMTGGDSVELKFRFASEEYSESVNSTFQDAFVFFLTGPGCGSGVNIATVPGTNRLPVNVRHISFNHNRHLYQDNNPFTLAGQHNPKRKAQLNQARLQNFQYDGFTKTLTAGFRVQPKKAYHIKIVIGDVGDGQQDSAILLEAGSFSSLYSKATQARIDRRKARQDSIRRADSLAAALRAQAIADSIAAVKAREAAIADSLARLEAARDSDWGTWEGESGTQESANGGMNNTGEVWKEEEPTIQSGQKSDPESESETWEDEFGKADVDEFGDPETPDKTINTGESGGDPGAGIPETQPFNTQETPRPQPDTPQPDRQPHTPQPDRQPDTPQPDRQPDSPQSDRHPNTPQPAREQLDLTDVSAVEPPPVLVVNFTPDNHLLPPDMLKKLAEHAAWMKQNPDRKFLLNVSASAQDTEERRNGLNELRLAELKIFLKKQGMAVERIVVPDRKPSVLDMPPSIIILLQ